MCLQYGIEQVLYKATEEDELRDWLVDEPQGLVTAEELYRLER
ncbi:hypothetical protein [Vibrio hepatarius]|nr:hypothetical protein [Vibrio hepatarius]